MSAPDTADLKSKPIAPERSDFRFWTEEKLRNADTDQFGHVNHAALASFFEAGRMELFRGRPPQPETSGADIVVVRLLMNFHRELYYPGTLAVGAAVRRVGNASFNVFQGLFDSEGCVASAEATCVLIDHKTRRPVRAPDALRSYLLHSGT